MKNIARKRNGLGLPVSINYDRRNPFVDRVKVLISSGAGGDGASIMAHEHSNEFAGPGGGNGGQGGNVFVRCTRTFPDLSHVKQLGSQVAAPSGSVGYSRTAHGKSGEDLWLDLPLGTQIVDVDTNVTLFDLEEENSEVLLLEGGQGGKGNASFANKWHHSPQEATKGLPGNTILAQLELKMIADCGLVGYPNAGKSTFLGAVTTSQPKVAPYAFTTIHPTIGIVCDVAGNTCKIADLPGLIEGAYENRGLGHQFLRHVERTDSIIIMLDMVESYVPGDRRVPQEPWQVLKTLQDELDFYLPGLSEKVLMVLANKCDVDADASGTLIKDKLAELRRRTSLPVFPISAALGRAMGSNCVAAGLQEPLQFMCKHVFERNKRIDNIRRSRQAAEAREVETVFRSRHSGTFSKFTLQSSKPQSADEAESGEFSLVDQQLSNVLGASGHDEDFSAYEHLPQDGRLTKNRDLTLKGKYWSVTRKREEKLSSERWH